MFTCTVLRHALLEWQTYEGVHPIASRLELSVDGPDRSDYFNYKNDSGKNASCFAATGRKLLTSPGVADTYAFLINTWNSLPERYQQRVYNKILTTVKRQIQQAENPTPAVVISVEAALVDNAILLEYLTSEVALEEAEIRSTDPIIPIYNHGKDDKLDFGMPAGSGDYEDEGDESAVNYAIPTASRRRWPMTELQRFDLRTSDPDGYEGEDGDDAYAHKEEAASQSDNGST